MKIESNVIKKASCAGISLALVASLTPAFVAPAYADAGKVVTIGADLTSAQRQQVLDFFGLDDDDMKQVEEITVNNTEEREYLDGVMPDSQIGTKTISCSYIEPTTSGGVNVQTANLTYVSSGDIHNAIETSGIKNCNVVVTAPYAVSGTGALTGIFKAYETTTGEKLDEDKKKAATEELKDTSDLEQTYGDEAANVVSDVKNDVASSGGNLTDEQIEDIVKKAAEANGVNLSDADEQKIIDIAKKVQELGYDSDQFSNTLSDMQKKLDNVATKQQADGILGAIQGFFQQIGNFFASLFGGNSDSSTSDNGNTVFSNLNTDVFQLDSDNDNTPANASSASNDNVSNGESNENNALNGISTSSDEATSGSATSTYADSKSSNENNAGFDATTDNENTN